MATPEKTGIKFPLILIFILINLTSSCNSDFIFTAIAPKVIRPNSIYNASVSIDNAYYPVNLTASIYKGNKKIISQQQLVLNSNTSTIVQLNVKYLNANKKYFISFKAIEIFDETGMQALSCDSINICGYKNNALKPYNYNAPLHVDKKPFSFLIQTDKPIYNRGETVRFRVILVDRFLKPAISDNSLQVEIYDSKKNLIKSWKNLKPHKKYAFIKQNFLLSKEPNLGDWEIFASSANLTSEPLKFSVDEYVLPSFEINMKSQPTFITFSDPKFNVEISAKYTFGKPVKGRCTISLSSKFYRIYHYSKYDEDDSNESQEVNKPEKVSKTVEMDGKANVEFDLEKDLKLTEEDMSDGQYFAIHTTCEEILSGKTRNSSLTISLYKYPYKITIEQGPEYSGMQLKTILKVTTQDNNPVYDPNEDALEIRHGFGCDFNSAVIFKPIPITGLVTLIFNNTFNKYTVVETFDVVYKNLTETIWLPRKRNLDSQDITMKLETLKTSDASKAISVTLSEPFKSIHYVLTSKGDILTSKLINFPEPNIIQNFTVETNLKARGKLNLVAYVVLLGQNVTVFNNLILDINRPDLKIKVENTSYKPGSNVTIHIRGQANSLVALRSIDQSVLLQKDDNDITLDKLNHIQKSYLFETSYSGWKTSKQSFEELELNSMHLIGNSNVQSKWYNTDTYGYGWGSYSMQNSNKKTESTPRVRKNFPETWFFLEEETFENGNLTLYKSIPDTITSWIITGFQISPSEGIVLTDSNITLTSFRPFFIVLHCPYSVIKGEVFSLQVLVHNYMETEIEASVSLNNTENAFEFVEENEESETKTVSVQLSSVSVVTFLITPIKIGTISLDVKAIGDLAGDALSHSLKVKPPGVKQSHNSPIFINLLNETSQTFNLSANFPNNRVADSETLKFSVIGDILGGALRNLDKLIMLPSGCGEQNMLNFVPNIVVWDYLNNTNSLSSEISEKIITFLETGFQQELTYKRRDGSFSAFGNSDEVGSTWLTAFVIRSFISAKRLITIDYSVIKSGIRFLTQQQSENGSFIEEGYVHDLSLQGGLGSNPFALTAFTLLTFVEAKNVLPAIKRVNYPAIIQSGLTYLINNQNKIKDLYAINLMTYLLHIVDHPKKDEFFKLMEKMAKTDAKNNLKHWEQNFKKATNNYGHEVRVNSGAVEMTSYALLTYLIRERKQLKDSIPIAQWLIQQRNEAGGFISTQDTVVGITALAQFSEAIKTPVYDVKVKVSWGFDQLSSYNFYIGNDNRTTLHEYFVPINVSSVQISAFGTGTALVQLTYSYYTSNGGNSSAFDLDVKAETKDNNRRLEMLICLAYTADTISNMVIMEVNSPTGYSFDLDELKKLTTSPQIMRQETENQDTKLHVYFSYLNNIHQCIKVFAYRSYYVTKHANASVIVYDYYDTTRKTQKFYSVNVSQFHSPEDS